MARARAVQMPGDVQPAVVEPVPAEAEAVPTEAPAASTASDGDEVLQKPAAESAPATAVTSDEIAALRAQLAATQQALDAERAARAASAAAPKIQPTAGPAPDASAVNPHRIGGAVLTQQGYVVPASFGAPAAKG